MELIDYTHIIFIRFFGVRQEQHKTCFEIPCTIYQTHKSVEPCHELMETTKNLSTMDAFMKRHYEGTSWYNAYTRLHKRVMKSCTYMAGFTRTSIRFV